MSSATSSRPIPAATDLHGLATSCLRRLLAGVRAVAFWTAALLPLLVLTALVSGAAIRLEGQIGVFNRRPASPCYACLYPEGEEETAERCSEVGVLGPLVGIIGSMQAMEAIKILADIGECLDGRVQILDAQRMEWRSVKLGKDPQCPVCSNQTL
jgi:adenylyltransferase/sulfurtransferase